MAPPPHPGLSCYKPPVSPHPAFKPKYPIADPLGAGLPSFSLCSTSGIPWSPQPLSHLELQAPEDQPVLSGGHWPLMLCTEVPLSPSLCTHTLAPFSVHCLWPTDYKSLGTAGASRVVGWQVEASQRHLRCRWGALSGEQLGCLAGEVAIENRRETLGWFKVHS